MFWPKSYKFIFVFNYFQKNSLKNQNYDISIISGDIAMAKSSLYTLYNDVGNIFFVQLDNFASFLLRSSTR